MEGRDPSIQGEGGILSGEIKQVFRLSLLSSVFSSPPPPNSPQIDAAVSISLPPFLSFWRRRDFLAHVWSTRGARDGTGFDKAGTKNSQKLHLLAIHLLPKGVKSSFTFGESPTGLLFPPAAATWARRVE